MPWHHCYDGVFTLMTQIDRHRTRKMEAKMITAFQNISCVVEKRYSNDVCLCERHQENVFAEVFAGVPLGD